eukprot:599940-Rhodomonas_salina.4
MESVTHGPHRAQDAGEDHIISTREPSLEGESLARGVTEIGILGNKYAAQPTAAGTFGGLSAPWLGSRPPPPPLHAHATPQSAQGLNEEVRCLRQERVVT